MHKHSGQTVISFSFNQLNMARESWKDLCLHSAQLQRKKLVLLCF